MSSPVSVRRHRIHPLEIEVPSVGREVLVVAPRALPGGGEGLAIQSWALARDETAWHPLKGFTLPVDRAEELMAAVAEMVAVLNRRIDDDRE